MNFLMKGAVLSFFLATWAPIIKASLTWSYDSDSACSGSYPCSPSDWYKVSTTCTNGASPQSPINIASSIVQLDTKTQGPIINDYSSCNDWKQYVTDGSVLRVELHEMCDLQMHYEDKEYLLQSAEFHSPSEHSVGGGHYDGEIQFLHFNNETNSYFVMSVFLQAASQSLLGNSNTFLDAIWKATSYNSSVYNVTVSSSSSSSTLEFDPYTELFPSKTAQFHYFGSLTYPPCLTMEWFVFEQPVSVSVADITFLRKLIASRGLNSLSSTGNNNRPLQSLLSRSVAYLPGGSIPTFSPTFSPSKRPSVLPTRGPTVFIHPGPYKVKVKSAMIVACLALSMTGIVIVAVVVWQIYVAFVQKDWNEYRRVGELETK